MQSFTEILNESNIEKLEKEIETLSEEEKTKFKDITKKELQAIWSEMDLDIKKEKAKILIDQLAGAEDKKAKLIKDIENAKSAATIDRLITNVAMIGMRVIK